MMFDRNSVGKLAQSGEFSKFSKCHGMRKLRKLRKLRLPSSLNFAAPWVPTGTSGPGVASGRLPALPQSTATPGTHVTGTTVAV